MPSKSALGVALLAPLSVTAKSLSFAADDPFAIVDEQKWVNPDDMTWDDYTAPPNTNWKDPDVKGSERNFNIALVTVDYDDQPFAVTQDAESTIFGNPQPIAANIARKDVPKFYHDLLNKPNELNQGHTLHEYWMEDSGGRYGVDLTVFGAYKLPGLSYQYGIDDWMNEGSCPGNATCNLDLRADTFKMWRDDVGDDTADSFELAFILAAGQDESGSWQEFGQMKWASKDDIPEEFGPPDQFNEPDNWGNTRYVPWTSWASAATIWPNAGSGSSTQAESSGMGVFAHELTHLLNIGDNYNNPYGEPVRRAYTGPWSMMSRGSFNGPGGPHTRWQIPCLMGSAMGSLHTIRDKTKIGLHSNSSVVNLNRAELAKSGIVTKQVTARVIKTEDHGVRIHMDQDNSPTCDPETDPLCDGGGYNFYDIEVVDRMGADSFQPDSGVMISKAKLMDEMPFQWTIDANPEDLDLVDFMAPDGSEVKITMGDYRQLADALFHAGTRSGSEFEYIDKENKLHFYILQKHRNSEGILSYTVAVRSLDGSGDSKFGLELEDGKVDTKNNTTPTGKGVFCTFDLTNSGEYTEGGDHPDDVSDYVGNDIYRLKAEVEGEGWRVAVPNALVAAPFGETVKAQVAVGASEDADDEGVVTLSVTSESDPEVEGTAKCTVSKA